MLRRRILKSIRLIILVMLGLVLGTLIGGIFYLNQSGVNEQWREKIALELENLGLVADFDSLRYEPTRGLVAIGVRIYSNENRNEVMARLERIVIDVDKTKLMRGKLRVNNVALSNAAISLPIDPEDPESPRIIIEKLQGNMHLPDKNTIEARKVSGVIAGIQLSLDAHIWSKYLKAPSIGGEKQTPSPEAKERRISRIKALGDFIEEISHWRWPSGKPPQLKVYAEGNIDDPDSAHIEFLFTATQLERDDIILHKIKIKGDFNNKIVTLDHISLNDDTGRLVARADFQQSNQTSRFEITQSTLHLQKLIRKLFDNNSLHELTFSTPPHINCIGEINFNETSSPNIQLTGQLKMKNFSYKGVPFKQFKTEISVNNKNFFLTNIKATHTQGEFKGRVLLKDNIIQYETNSTLPASVFKPFITHPRAIKEVNHASFSSSSQLNIESKGIADLNKPDDWSHRGHALIKNFHYKGVPIKSAEGDYFTLPGSTAFTNIQLFFDYQNYALRKEYGGPTSGRVDSDKVTIDHKERMVHIDNIRTTSWPAPVVRLFAPKAADHCEQYRFFRPPSLTASGSFDMNLSQARTDFKIDVRAPGSTHYEFLDESLTLTRLRGKVRIRQNRVDATDISFYTFQGPCHGEISVRPKQKTYKGSVHSSRLHLKDIGDLYDFNNAERGLITGRLDFTGTSNDISQFNGTGSLALERGNLFSIPMMGPLTPLIGAVLGKKNPTNEQAENASFTYVIQKGIIYSDNFLANTRSLRFTGEGKINLNNRQIDLLVRMNARGLFSVFTLPLQPFLGLFQFSGTGNLTDPKWKSAMFTSPIRGKKDPIFRRPPKARVIRE